MSTHSGRRRKSDKPLYVIFLLFLAVFAVVATLAQRPDLVNLRLTVAVGQCLVALWFMLFSVRFVWRRPAMTWLAAVASTLSLTMGIMRIWTELRGS